MKNFQTIINQDTSKAQILKDDLHQMNDMFDNFFCSKKTDYTKRNIMQIISNPNCDLFKKTCSSQNTSQYNNINQIEKITNRVKSNSYEFSLNYEIQQNNTSFPSLNGNKSMKQNFQQIQDETYNNNQKNCSQSLYHEKQNLISQSQYYSQYMKNQNIIIRNQQLYDEDSRGNKSFNNKNLNNLINFSSNEYEIFSSQKQIKGKSHNQNQEIHQIQEYDQYQNQNNNNDEQISSTDYFSNEQQNINKQCSKTTYMNKLLSSQEISQQTHDYILNNENDREDSSDGNIESILNLASSLQTQIKNQQTQQNQQQRQCFSLLNSDQNQNRVTNLSTFLNYLQNNEQLQININQQNNIPINFQTKTQNNKIISYDTCEQQDQQSLYFPLSSCKQKKIQLVNSTNNLDTKKNTFIECDGQDNSKNSHDYEDEDENEQEGEDQDLDEDLDQNEDEDENQNQNYDENEDEDEAEEDEINFFQQFSFSLRSQNNIQSELQKIIIRSQNESFEDNLGVQVESKYIQKSSKNHLSSISNQNKLFINKNQKIDQQIIVIEDEYQSCQRMNTRNSRKPNKTLVISDDGSDFSERNYEKKQKENSFTVIESDESEFQIDLNFERKRFNQTFKNNNDCQDILNQQQNNLKNKQKNKLRKYLPDSDQSIIEINDAKQNNQQLSIKRQSVNSKIQYNLNSNQYTNCDNDNYSDDDYFEINKRKEQKNRKQSKKRMLYLDDDDYDDEEYQIKNSKKNKQQNIVIKKNTQLFKKGSRNHVQQRKKINDRQKKFLSYNQEFDEIISSDYQPTQKQKNKKMMKLSQKTEFKNKNFLDLEQSIENGDKEIFNDSQQIKNNKNKKMVQINLRKQNSIDTDPPKKSIRLIKSSNCIEIFQCTICLENPSQSYFGEINCSHRFCFECIQNWSKVTNQCPVCRKEFNQIIKKNFNGSQIQYKPTFVRTKKQKINEEDYLQEAQALQDEENRAVLGDFEERENLNADGEQKPSICYQCLQTDKQNLLLICDVCDENYCHTFCDEQIDSHIVPEGRWACHDCRC